MKKNIPQVVWQRLASEADASLHSQPELLAGFEDQVLSERERTELLGHLAVCSLCREVAFLALPPQPVPGRPETTGWAVSWLSPPQWGRVGLTWPGLLSGAALACAALGAVFFTHRPSRPQLAAQVPALSSTRAEDTGRVQAATPISREQATGAPRGRLAPAPGADQGSRYSPRRDAITAVPTFSTRTEYQDDSQAPVAAANQSPEEEEAAPGSVVEPLAESLVAQWGVSPQGSLRRSWDGGKTWQGVAVDSGAVLRVVSVWHRQVWAGGLGGALYESPDYGEHWVVTRPEAKGEVLGSDITSIQCLSAGSAVVTSRDGASWSTQDSGQSWQKR